MKTIKQHVKIVDKTFDFKFSLINRDSPPPPPQNVVFVWGNGDSV